MKDKRRKSSVKEKERERDSERSDAGEPSASWSP